MQTTLTKEEYKISTACFGKVNQSEINPRYARDAAFENFIRDSKGYVDVHTTLLSDIERFAVNRIKILESFPNSTDKRKILKSSFFEEYKYAVEKYAKAKKGKTKINSEVLQEALNRTNIELDGIEYLQGESARLLTLINERQEELLSRWNNDLKMEPMTMNEHFSLSMLAIVLENEREYYQFIKKNVKTLNDRYSITVDPVFAAVLKESASEETEFEELKTFNEEFLQSAGEAPVKAVQFPIILPEGDYSFVPGLMDDIPAAPAAAQAAVKPATQPEVVTDTAAQDVSADGMPLGAPAAATNNAGNTEQTTNTAAEGQTNGQSGTITQTASEAAAAPQAPKEKIGLNFFSIGGHKNY